MKCCANCGWSISPTDEEEMLKEIEYNEEDIFRPKAGDCCLGIPHNGNFVCKEHLFSENMIGIDVLYDDKYLGIGYFIIAKYSDEIVNFIKIYKTDGGLTKYNIRGCEVDSIEDKNKQFSEIKIKISSVEHPELFNIISEFAKSINNSILYSTNVLVHGNNNLMIEMDQYNVYLILSKDKCGDKNKTNFIDMELVDYLTCEKYKEIDVLFKNLSKITIEKEQEATMKKVLKISRNRGI